MSERRPDHHRQPTRSQPTAPGAEPVAAARPRYEPPRLARKRSVARVTLASNNFGGSGPVAGGLTGPG